jgi:hypothetical protein
MDRADQRTTAAEGTRRMRLRAWRAVDATLAAGVASYDRRRHLPRLIPIGPDEIEDESLAGRMRLVFRLARALRSERARARAGHWTYDLNRHLGLKQAFEAETRALPRRQRPGPAQ